MTRIILTARWPVLLGLAVAVSGGLGCGSVEPPTGSLSGNVTYNGQPVTAGVVTLVNDQAGMGASGELDASGRYRIESVRTGQYKVAIHRQPPPPESGPEVFRSWKLNIPEKYQDLESSGLSATVSEGKNTADFSL